MWKIFFFFFAIFSLPVHNHFIISVLRSVRIEENAACSSFDTTNKKMCAKNERKNKFYEMFVAADSQTVYHPF